jgi:hypothetical protein
MTTRTITHKHKTTKKILWQVTESIPDEVLVFCPSCKALDVVRFSGQGMIPTRKFTQQKDKVFHTCGSLIPCRFHRLGGRDQLTATRTSPRLPLSSHISRQKRTHLMARV